MKKTIFWCLSMTIFVTSCTELDFLEPVTKQVEFSDVEVKLIDKMFTPHQVSKKEALFTALRAMRNQPRLGMKRVRHHSDVDTAGITCNPIVINGDSVSANLGYSTIDLQDTIAYIFTDKDNGGLTIVSADNRIDEQILAYVEHDNLSEGDTLNETASFIIDLGMF